MNNRILIAGGDMRQLYCAARLSRSIGTYLIGFDADIIPDDINVPLADAALESSFDCAVLPVPSVDENGCIYSPCSSAPLTVADIERLLSPEGIILAGKADERLHSAFPRREIIDYMLREELNLKNAVPTAEGAVQLALEELPVTLNGLRVLVVGMGRIGTALAEILKGFGADITVAVHNSRGAAKAKLHGLRSVPTRRIGSGYGLVFNTVPALVFDRKLLEFSDRSTLFIDLASRPGGIDFKAALELGIKAIWALGLPGKTAPVTAGEIIADTVSSILSERSESIE